MVFSSRGLKLRRKWEMPLLLRELKKFFAEQGIEGYLVGGYVRDSLTGRANNDIDIAVAGDAIDIGRLTADFFGGRCVVMDEANKVARVVLLGESLGVGEGWHLDFSSVRGSIEEDLAERDFTINAIAIDLREVEKEQAFTVIDPFDGCHDLARGRIQVVSEDAFRHDPARLLRAVRFAAELGFTIESDTEALIRRDHHLVTDAAAERLRDELCRVVAVTGAAHWLGYLDSVGLLTTVIPELAATEGVKQPKEHFWDVFHHSLQTVEAIERLLNSGGGERDKVLAAIPWIPVIAQHFDEEVGGGRTRMVLIKIAGLLHDIAKPATRTVEEGGRIRFLGHAKIGAEMAGGILERLRFNSREVKMAQAMIRYHLRPGQMGNGELPSGRAIYRYFRDAGEVGIDTLFLNLADHLATRGPLLDIDEWRRHTRAIAYVLSQYLEGQGTVTPPKLISGHDLMERFGLGPGPKIGELLEAVREAQAGGEVTTKEDALALAERLLYIQAFGGTNA